ncbi:MAG: KamA family radical SAM protein [Deltaproteobacteria bacterium]|nr:KamA family radical SAM protein [Deltaproteobacteria bacterium]
MALEIITVNKVRERFKPAGKGVWAHVPDSDWHSWIWQQQQRVKNMAQLEKVIKVTDDERVAYEKSNEMFNMGITPYYATLMDPDDATCPVRQQSVPSTKELNILPEDLEDPLAEERDMPVPGVTHRYPDRVLFYTTHNCPVYCRHCTRKRKVSDPGSAAQLTQLDNGLKYIEATKTIRDVIISGGDPLSLSDDRLEWILSRLRACDHIETIRLGSRNLVTLPFRITDNFINMIRKYHPIHINTHFNHPKECTQEAYDTATRLADAGCTLGNQAVLLKGINDKPEIFKELVHKLMLMRIRPYYIYQCDLSQGISHFRTPVEKGIEIIEALRGHTSGLCIPQYVVDAPGGGGKIPVNPNYIVKHEGKKWVLRNFRKQEFTYFEPN